MKPGRRQTERRKNDSERRRRWLFSASERRGILLLLPLLVLLAWLLVRTAAPRPDGSAQLLGDRLVGQTAAGQAEGPAAEADTVRLFAFDPNEVTYEELRQLGMPKRTAAGLVKYRAAGKVFAVPEDVALCYGVTDSMYARLKPYIVIGEAYRLFESKEDGVMKIAVEEVKKSAPGTYQVAG